MKKSLAKNFNRLRWNVVAVGEDGRNIAGCGTVKTVPYGAGQKAAAPVGARIVRPLRVWVIDYHPQLAMKISAASRQMLMNFVFDILMIE